MFFKPWSRRPEKKLVRLTLEALEDRYAPAQVTALDSEQSSKP